MEARKITVISTKTQTTKVFESTAETLGELKEDLARQDIDFTDMAFYEGVSKTELKSDDSLLPRDLNYKGKVTNDLVFMLTDVNKKIKSGIDRTAVYREIKKRGLVDVCSSELGKNFTRCKTSELLKLLSNYEPVAQSETQSEKNKGAKTYNSYNIQVSVTSLKSIDDVINRIVNTIDKMLSGIDADFNVTSNLDLNAADSDKGKAPYSEEEIDDMFRGWTE